jgi:hypothetical protein
MKNKQLYIISPHFDDAVLSAGMLMHNLQGKCDVTIINIFTKAHNGPYTISAKQFLKSAGFKNAVNLYKDRLINDRLALSLINAKQVNLNFTDALFRRKKIASNFGKILAEFDHLYPTYRLHVIKQIAKSDSCSNILEKKLKLIIPKDALVFSPLSFGNHVDHLITRMVCEKLFKNLIYYSDFPYNIRSNSKKVILKEYQKVALKVDMNIKRKLVNCYASQVSGLFTGGKMPKHSEYFYLKGDTSWLL